MVPDDKILKDNYNVISIYDSCDHIVYCILHIYNKVQAKYNCLVIFHGRLFP